MLELVITIVIISIAMTALVGAFSFSIRHSADVMWQSRTAYLGQAYLEEILSREFDEVMVGGGTNYCGAAPLVACTAAANLGPDAGEARATFDDVDDYNGLNNEVAMVTIAAETGLANPYAGYRVSVTVAYDNATNGNDMLKIITVTVTPPGAALGYPFSAVKGNF